MKLYSGVLQIARIRYTSTGGQITFPSRDTTGRKAVKTSESGSIAVQDITYTQKVMDAYKYTDALKLSWELLQDSEFDILQEFQDAFSESFGRAANETLTIGDGTGDPNGIVTAASAGLTAASATAITLGELIDLSHKVDPAYRTSNSCGYMLNDALLATIKKLSLAATNDGAGTWQPSFRDGTPATINGFPYWLNQDMASTIATATKVVLFGDYSKYNVRIVKDMTIMRNDALHMATGEVGFYAHARWDGELFDSTAVKYLVTA
jgi:HK97 family phage major capsid protein